MVDAGHAASAAGRNAYYAMASFIDTESRTQGNVLSVKAFWLDVDCKNKDPLKDYATQEEGLQAIQHFCKAHSFPRPTIVNSGSGWHVYWVLTEAITKDEWQPVATKLKLLCLNGQLNIDPACTADSARILRIPDTLNYRSEPPAPVVLTLQSSEVFFDAFSLIVDAAWETVGGKPTITIPGGPTKKEISAATKALMGNTTSSFKKIMMKCAAGTGCAQIEHGVLNQATLEEPLWRGMLSIAQCCTDKDKAIHLVSKDHPEYDNNAAVRKAEQTKGPYTCATFDGLNSGVCTACPHWKHITSPIQLGKEVMEVQAPVVVHAVVEAPVAAVAVEGAPLVKLDVAAIDAALVVFHHDQANVTIPIPPKPYIRGQNGGIYKRLKQEDGTFDDVLIYENDFYAHSRMYDPNEGQVLACRLHLPMDGIRNFNIPLRVVGSKDRLRELVCAQGVAANDKTVAELSHYLIGAAKELQHMHKEEKARTQMGWQDDKTFVLGNREYSNTGIRHCPPSSATQNYQHMFRMEGSLGEWRKVVDAYKHPGFEVYQFIFLMALSSPLLGVMKQPGMLVSIMSDESGLGKTTLQHLCNSIWGHPKDMMSMPDDKILAITNRMGVFNSLALCIDEFTNKPPEECSDIIYMSTHGRGRERMLSSANIERVNTTRWAKFTIVSANSALRDKVASLKASTEGENMRLFEFDVRGTPKLDKQTADTIFPLIYENYGVAGHIMASYLVANTSMLAQHIKTVQRRVDKVFGFTSKERNWSHAVAGVFAMAWIAKELRLHDFDVQALELYMVDKIKDMRGEVVESVTQHDSMLGEFMVANHMYVLVINGMPDAHGLVSPPVNRNINKIMARYEPDTGKLYIVTKDLRDYCVKRQFSYNSLVNLSGGKPDIRRIAAGTGVVAGPIRVIAFNTKAAGLDMTMWSEQNESLSD